MATYNYAPPQGQPQPYAYPPQQQPPQPYPVQPQPHYQPQQQQQQWGLQQEQQHQYFTPTGTQSQGQSMTGVVPPSYETAAHGTVNPETGLPAKFNPRPKYNDCWAFVLFMAQLAGFVVLSYFAISRIANDSQSTPGSGGKGSSPLFGFFSKSGLITMFISIGVGTVISVLYFLLTQSFPRQVIKTTFALSILLYLAVAAYYVYLRIWFLAIFGIIFGVLYASMWFFWRSKIPFATVMLHSVTTISKKFPATYVLAFVGLFIQVVYSIYFLTVLAGTYELYYDTTTRTTPVKLQVLIVFCFFSFYWTSQVVSNIVHVTISGVFATWYFMAGSPQGMQASPTMASLKRACTTSIGSICFGSLIIAVIQTLRAIAHMFRQDGDGILAFVACLIDCILGCIQSAAEFLNKYSFTQVAIYGKAFIPAAKDTWNMLKSRGVETIINDSLITTVWAMAALLSGVLSGLASYLYLRFSDPVFNSNGEFTIILVIIGFVMGLQITFTVGTVIDSGVATTFVALAEDPAALARTQPELFERIRATYPEVVQGVNY